VHAEEGARPDAGAEIPTLAAEGRPYDPPGAGDIPQAGRERVTTWVAVRGKRTRVPGSTMALGRGGMPHDLIQMIVEGVAGLDRGFWGSVAAGATFKGMPVKRTTQGRAVIAANRQELDVAGRFTDPSARRSAEADLALIDAYDEQIRSLELYLSRAAKVDDPQAYQRLTSVPGVGKVLALVLLYEIHDIRRFPSAGQFLSYARLVRCAHESAGKKKGSGGNKIGNAHLKWAFSEATCLFLRASEQAKRWLARREKKYGKARALGALAARLGRAVYHLPRKEEAFDGKRFFAS
jgi:hypothetical protein